MKDEEMLERLIESHRNVSQDGSLVTYDLTSGIDFSHPKKLAQALANVFFEHDAKGWFKASQDEMDFVPDYKVRVVLSEGNGKLLEEVVEDFLKDLKGDELTGSLSSDVKDEVENASRLGLALTTGALRSALYGHSEKKVYRNYIKDDLLLDLIKSLEIRTLNDRELLDWKNLPL